MQQNLVLILARDLADKLASAMFLVDADGTLVYFNEGAAEILGRTFAEAGHLPIESWAKDFNPSDLEGTPIEANDVPLVVALRERRPVHRQVRVQGLDEVERVIAVTALPLFARTDELVGAAAIFWEPDQQ